MALLLGETAVKAQEAQEKAEQLLLRHLDAAQRAHYAAANSIYVVGKLGRYLLNGTATVIYWPVVPDGFLQRMGVWVSNISELPIPDRILADKLWIEADECGFLCRGCRSPLPDSVLVCACPECRKNRPIGDAVRAFFGLGPDEYICALGNDAGP